MTSGVNQLAKKFKDEVVLKKRIAELEEENRQLKDMLKSATLAIKSDHPTIHVDFPEEVIIETQIALLEKTSTQRELQLDEVKKLDYLVKNKILIEENKAKKKKNVDELTDVTDENLMSLIEKK